MKGKDTAMAIYYALTGVLCIPGYALSVCIQDEKKKKTAALCYTAAAFCILTVFASLRYAIGFDYFSYQDIYEMTVRLSFRDILHTYWYEPLFFVACKLSGLMHFPYPVFVACVSGFLLFAAMQFVYRCSPLPWLSVYLYITLQFLAYDMNLLRQAVALSFFLLAYPYLRDKKPVRFAALLLAGGLFHNSLLIILPFCFLLPVRINRKLSACLLAVTAGVYLLFDPLFELVQPCLPEKYAVYEESYYWNANTFEYTVFPFAYALLIFLFRNRIACPRRRQIYVNSALSYSLISLFITKHFILERFAVYPFALSLIAIPDIVSSFQGGAPDQKNPHARLIVTALFMAVSGGYFLFAASRGFHNVYPYVSLFDRSITIPAAD